MNDAVYNFKRYEDSSLEYTGLKMHADDEDVGLFSTVISREDYEHMASQQGSSMQMPVMPVTEVDKKTFTPATKKEPELKKTSYPSYIKSPVMKVAEGADKTKDKNKEATPEVHVGDVINHNKFGKGTVISLGENKFSVQFAEGTKTLGMIALTNGIATIEGGKL